MGLNLFRHRGEIPKPQQPEIGGAESGRNATIDDALNTPGFAEFLAKHPDKEQFDLKEENAEAINSKLETFKQARAISKEIKGVVNEIIYKDVAIKPDANELKNIDEYIQQQAVENPASLKTIAEQIAAYHESMAEVARAEEELAPIAAKYERTTAARDRVAQVGGWQRWLRLGQSTEDQQVIQAAKKAGLKPTDLEWNDEKIQMLLDKRTEAEHERNKMIARCEDTKNALIGSVDVDQGLIKAIRSKVAERLKFQAAKNASQRNLAGIRQELGRLDSIEAHGGLSYLEGLDQDEFQAEMDEAATLRAEAEIRQAVMETPLGNKALDTMEKNLGHYLKFDQLEIGSKIDEDAEEIVMTSLAKVYRELQATESDDPKLFFIQRIGRKHGETDIRELAQNLPAEESRQTAAKETAEAPAATPENTAPTAEATGEAKAEPAAEPVNQTAAPAAPTAKGTETPEPEPYNNVKIGEDPFYNGKAFQTDQPQEDPFASSRAFETGRPKSELRVEDTNDRQAA